MDSTATLVLAVVAAATGTLAILGVIVFFAIVFYKHHKRRQQHRRATEGKINDNRSMPTDRVPNDTASAMTNDNSKDLETDIEAVLDLEDGSIATSAYHSKAFGRGRSTFDMDSCYGDDNWSYSVAEEGSVLQELSLKKHASSSSTSKTSKTSKTSVPDSKHAPIPVYGGNNGVMYEV
jgi:hypothetical protein